MDNLDELWHNQDISLYGDGCVTGGRPGLQTRACGTNTVVDRFDSYTSPPDFEIIIYFLKVVSHHPYNTEWGMMKGYDKYTEKLSFS